MRRAAFVAALALGCGACATMPTGHERVEQGQRALAQARVCCNGLAEAAHQPLPLTRTVVEIDDKAQVFVFGGTRSFFVLYELPPFAQPYSITIVSLPAGVAADQAQLLPRVALFDASFAQMRLFDDTSLRRRGAALERAVFVNAKDSGERYLAIFASDAGGAVESAYSRVDDYLVPVGPVLVKISRGVDAKTTLRPAPTGTVVIEVEGLSLPSASPPGRHQPNAN